MQRKILITAVIFCVLLLLLGCPNGTVTLESVLIEDDITTPTTWTAGVVYVITDWEVWVYSTLTIEEGSIIKFMGTYSELVLGSGGTINATGTAADPIIFTSYKDDIWGGDTNGDGTATTPAMADWGMIITNGENGSIFSYCEFYYGGNSTYTATLHVDTGSVATVSNCTFAYNSGNDSSGWYGALSADTAGAGTVITGNTFYNNVRPLSISTAFDLDGSNVFHNPDDTSITNDFNGIYAYDNGDQKTLLSWGETEVAYIIDDNDWWIDGGASVTLADNVVLKFRSGGEMVLTDGASNIVNYNGTGVAFTSYKDDSLKGDTNGDGSASSPSNGDWGGIYDDFNSTYLGWANIYYD